MLKNREELEKILKDFITTHNDLRKYFNKIRKYFIDKGILVAKFNEVWTNPDSLNSADMPILFVLTKAIGEIDEKIKLEEWFTETEITDGNNYTEEHVEEKITYPIIVSNVLKGKDDQYMAYVPAKIIKLWFDSSLLPYNFDTQRNPKYKDKEGELVKTININIDSVKEIASEMDKNKFITNCITLNILQDGTESFEYKKGDLIIYSGQINPIDGFHRIQAMLIVLAEDPDNDYLTEVRFTNWDTQKCKEFIGQEDKRNKIDTRYINSAINVEKWGNKVVSILKDGGMGISSDLKGKIAIDPIHIEKHKSYTMFDIMSDTIDNLYTLKSNLDVKELAKWLAEFFDYIIGSYPDEFITDIKGTKEKSIINMPLTFVGYLTLSKILKGKDSWEEKAIDILLKIDWNISNPLWKTLGIVKNKKPITRITKPVMMKIINYFEEVGQHE